MLLAAYDYDIQYKPGSRIAAADAMSHLPLSETADTPTLGSVICLVDHLENCMVDSADIRTHTRRDPVLAKVVQALQLGWTYLAHDPQYAPFRTRQNELTLENGCIL